MSLLSSASAIRQAYTPDSAVCPVLSPTHPHAAYLSVTGLYPEAWGWRTMVDWQVRSATFSSSWWHCALFVAACILRASRLWPMGGGGCFKCFIMSQVFCIWLESMQTTADYIISEMIMFIVKAQTFLFSLFSLFYFFCFFFLKKTTHLWENTPTQMSTFLSVNWQVPLHFKNLSTCRFYITSFISESHKSYVKLNLFSFWVGFVLPCKPENSQLSPASGELSGTWKGGRRAARLEGSLQAARIGE